MVIDEELLVRPVESGQAIDGTCGWLWAESLLRGYGRPGRWSQSQASASDLGPFAL